jgi:hypothetical protein
MSFGIPRELVRSLNRGRLTMFVGHDLDVGESGMPSMARLTAELAGQTTAWMDCPLCNKANGCTRSDECVLSFRQVATTCAQELGRDYLLRFLTDRLIPNSRSMPILQAIRRLPVQTVVTTIYDDRLELAYRAAKIRYQAIVTDAQLASDDAAQVQIIHLYGALSHPDSLVLTESDHAALFTNRPLTAVLLQSLLATRDCLFVGLDFNDPYLQTLYSTVVKELGTLRRWPYVLGSRRRSILKCIELPASSHQFLVELTSQIEYRPAAMPEAPDPEVPYKFLDYFEAKDRAVFVGRDVEINELTNRVLSHRVTALYAYSGMGKTSLIKAGVIPRLEFEGFRVVAFRLGANPAETLQHSLEQLGTGADSATTASTSSESASLGTVLVLDQVEELFTAHTRESREVFANALIAALRDEHSSLHVLLSLRIEYLGQLDDLFAGQGGSDILGNRFRLGALGPEQARQAILRPAARFDIQFESALTETLLTYLETTAFDPSQLQILCSRLYGDHLQQTDRADNRTISFARFNDLGGANGILSGFLEDALGRMDGEQSSAAARVILKNMVTVERTKIPLTLEQIAGRVAYASPGEADVRRILGLLQAQRIIRGLEDGAFELSHDILVPKIWTWMDEADIARLNAAQTLRQAMDDFEQYGLLMGADDQIAVEQAVGAISLKVEELALLLMSAIAVDDRQRALKWTALADANPDLRASTLLVLQKTQQSPVAQVSESAVRSEILLQHDRRALLESLTQRFDWSELQELCLYLDVDFDLLAGQGKTAKARELIRYFERAGKLDMLVALIESQRPGTIAVAIPPPPPSETSSLSALLNEHWSFEKFAELCQYLEWNPDNLGLSVGKRDQMRRLIRVMQSQNRLDHLRLAMGRFRPDLLDVAAESERTLITRFDIPQMEMLCFDLSADLWNGLLTSFDKRMLAQYMTGYFVSRDALSDLIEGVIFPERAGSNRYEIFLRRRLTERMSSEQLREVCFYVAVNWDDLAGESLNSKICALIDHFLRRARVGELMVKIADVWPTILSPDEVWQKIRLETEHRGQTLDLLQYALGELRSVSSQVKHHTEVVQDQLGQMQEIPSRSVLARFLEKHFNDAEFQNLCFELGFCYDDLRGPTLSNKVRDLIDHFERRDLLSCLATAIVQARPFLADQVKEYRPDEAS